MSQIQQVKEASDIVAVIGERVELQRAGTQLKGLCPFHSEKSPSFFVSEVMQRYKCFGCGESGDVLTFLERYDGMSFGEALQTLADRAGIQLDSYQPDKNEQEREELLAVLNLAKEYYHFLLTQHTAGEPARTYLKQRGTSAASTKLFQLGYSLDRWDGLVNFLHGKKKIPLARIEQAGLIIKGKGGRFYDRFRGRLMFPLKNPRGQVVGFSGRVLDGTIKEAKYINTPETLLYHKSQLLFGYSELFQEIRKKREIIVVEGEFDVISSAQVHVNHIVAVKGSALTADHIKLLGRVADKVVLALDSDAAGVEATKRAIELIRQTSLELRVIQIPGGKDPDELSRKDPAAWREAVKQSVSAYHYLLEVAAAQHDPTTPEGKRHIIADLSPLYAAIPHAVEKEYYLKKLAQVLQVREQTVREDVQRFGQSKTATPKKAAAKPATTPVAPTRRGRLERYLLYIILQLPASEYGSLIQLTEAQWQTPSLRHFSQALAELQHPLTESQLKSVLRQLPADLQQELSTIELDPSFPKFSTADEIREEWYSTWRELKMEVIRTEIDEITRQLDALDQKVKKTPAEEEQQVLLLQKIVTLKAQTKPEP